MIQDSLTVIVGQARIVFGVLLCMVLSQGLVGSALKLLFGRQLTSTDRLTLGLGGWILPISILSLLWIFLGGASALTVLLLLLILTLLPARLQPDPEPASPRIAVSLVTFVLLSILLRLVFVSKAVLPSYFDSAQHYSLIRNILLNETILPAGSAYYHAGFHMLTAFIVTVLNVDIAETMLILGQMVLAVMPVGLFFLVRHATRSLPAAFLAAILSALGWYMPAHAVNWGKYPALMSLGLISFVLSIAYVLYKNHQALSAQKWVTAYSVLALGVVITVITHSRALVILAMVCVAWVGATRWQGLTRSWRITLVIIVLSFLALAMLSLQQQGMLTLLFDPYIQKGIWITAPVLLLSVFAWWEYPQCALTCLFFVSLLLGGLFVPVQIPGYGPLTLLDRPLVEMILYLPLSLLGGLGWAGLEKLLPRTSFQRISIRGILFLLSSGLVVVHAFATYRFYPSECCVIAGNSDLTAIHWMDSHLPPEARIGISVTELEVVPSNDIEGYVGGDAGIWITPLIDRVTALLLYSSDFGAQPVWESLCQNRISHLYVGALGQSFDSTGLGSHPEWYRAVLSISGVRLYEVVGCR